MKKYFKSFLKHFPVLICTLALIAVLIVNPETASNGVKNGITLLLSTVIPSLFPFLVLASYIAESDSFLFLSKFTGRITQFIFKMNPNVFPAIIMGLLGGYPTGAKVTAELYKNRRITKNEAERLMFFCVNSGPAFTITAVGVSMLSSYRAGLILYFSSLVSSLTIGVICRFLSDKKEPEFNPDLHKDKQYIFVNSVASGSNAIINISAWVMTFSCISAIIESFGFNENINLFITSVAEVTSGCKACANVVSLPVISAILGFGSISVICQVSPFLNQCGVKLKYFVTARIINASLSAFFTFQLLKLFPEAQETIVLYADAQKTVGLSYTASATVILLLMCTFLILQVDNRRKIC